MLRLELEADRDMLRYIYQFDKDDPKPTTMRMNRVTFGCTTSPFMSLFILRLHAEKHKDEFPLAYEIIFNFSYIDDIVKSSNSIAILIETKRQLRALLKLAGMNLKKFNSNDDTILADLASEDKAPAVSSVLGVPWSNVDDSFYFEFGNNIDPEPKQFTKRSILSQIAKCYDLTGALQPFICGAKIILAQIWEHKDWGWDTPIPDSDLVSRFKEWRNQLSHLSRFKIPRYVFSPQHLARVTPVTNAVTPINNTSSSSSKHASSINPQSFHEEDEQENSSFMPFKAAKRDFLTTAKKPPDISIPLTPSRINKQRRQQQSEMSREERGEENESCDIAAACSSSSSGGNCNSTPGKFETNDIIRPLIAPRSNNDASHTRDIYANSGCVSTVGLLDFKDATTVDTSHSCDSRGLFSSPLSVTDNNNNALLASSNNNNGGVSAESKFPPKSRTAKEEEINIPSLHKKIDECILRFNSGGKSLRASRATAEEDDLCSAIKLTHCRSRTKLAHQHFAAIENPATVDNCLNGVHSSEVNRSSHQLMCENGLTQSSSEPFPAAAAAGNVVLDAKPLFSQSGKLRYTIPAKCSAAFSSAQTISKPKHDVANFPPFFPLKDQQINLCTFVDASNRAYGAVCYLLQRQGDEVQSRLIFSKSKVLPQEIMKNTNEQKRPTTPRSELLSMQLGSRLSDYVGNALNICKEQRFHWTDSAINLARLQRPAAMFATWTANRLLDVLKHSLQQSWRHVPTAVNPADHLSRSLSLDELLQSQNWFFGPDFLVNGVEPPQPVPLRNLAEIDAEIRPAALLATPAAAVDIASFNKLFNGNYILQKLEHISHFNSVTRIIALIFRWRTIARDKSYSAGGKKPQALTLNPFLLSSKKRRAVKDRDQSGRYRQAVAPFFATIITPDELDVAQQRLFEMLQDNDYMISVTKQHLRDNIPLPKDNLLRNYDVFLDGNLLRSRTRIQASHISYATRNPVVLAKANHYTTLFVLGIHQRFLCIGNNQTMHLLFQAYRIVGGRNEVRRIIRTCLVCRKHPKEFQPMMADLKDYRVTTHSFWDSIIVDHMGPIYYRHGSCEHNPCPHNKINKCYAVLFACLSTRYLQIEMVRDASTEQFLLAFARVTARLGKPKEVVSDNSKTFQGSETVIHELYAGFNFRKAAEQHQDIKWSYIVPKMSWSSGAIEKLVHLTKQRLTKLMKSNLLTYTQLCDAVLECSSIINSRPLIGKVQGDSSLTYVTPNSLALGRDTISLWPDGQSTRAKTIDTTNVNIDFLRQYRNRRRIVNIFWRQFSQSYLNSLAHHPRWRPADQPPRQAKIGDVILVLQDGKRKPMKLNEACPQFRGQWIIGRIIKVHIDPKDPRQVPRSATILLGNGKTIDRPVRKICLLEGDQGTPPPQPKKKAAAAPRAERA
jgi:hypothetical protein